MMSRTLASLLVVALNISAATAQGFPERQLTLIVPFPAGGPSDALGRAVAQAMAAHLKQSVIVENIGGASGTIGLTKLLKAPADGYSLGFGTIGTHVANVALFKRLPYDPVADFEPVGLAGMASTLLVAKLDLPASNLHDFVTYARANREKHLWQRRRRIDFALCLRSAAVEPETEHHPCSVSWRCPGDERSHGWSRRLHVRPDHHRAASSARRNNQADRSAE
jgi:tripartite-type tricarboxylate transporter receptor subunit TctC